MYRTFYLRNPKTGRIRRELEMDDDRARGCNDGLERNGLRYRYRTIRWRKEKRCEDDAPTFRIVCNSIASKCVVCEPDLNNH